MNTVGIDIGGTKVLALRRAADGAIEQQLRAATRPQTDGMMVTLLSLIDEVRNDQTRGVGIGIAALCEPDSGVVRWGPHTPLVDFPLAQELEAHTGLAVWVDNDANTAAVAECHSGALKGVEHGLLITLGTGIGSGLVLGGQVYRGRGFAGEVGHIKLVEEGLTCACGAEGCWETLASGRALCRQARRLSETGVAWADQVTGGPSDGALITDLALAGDPAAMAAVNGVGAWLGKGLALLNTVLDFERVALGGGLIRAGEQLLDPARGVLRESYGTKLRSAPELCVAVHGESAGALGAAIWAASRSNG